MFDVCTVSVVGPALGLIGLCYIIQTEMALICTWRWHVGVPHPRRNLALAALSSDLRKFPIK